MDRRKETQSSYCRIRDFGVIYNLLASLYDIYNTQRRISNIGSTQQLCYIDFNVAGKLDLQVEAWNSTIFGDC